MILSLLLPTGLIAFLPCFDAPGLISSSFDNMSRQLVVLTSNIVVDLRDWQLGKIISILQALTCLVKLLVNLTPFLYLEYVYNLNSIKNIVSSRQS